MTKTTYIFMMIIFVFFTACSNNKNEAEEKKTVNTTKENSIPKNNKQNITLQDTDGNIIEIKKTKKGFIVSGIEKKIVILDFFATWCPPCKAEIPHLNNLQEKYKDNLVIIGILLEQNKDNDEIKNFINYHSINYTITNSEGNFQLAKEVGGVQSIPFMIMYDKNGDYATHYMGAIPEEMIEADIQRVLK